MPCMLLIQKREVKHLVAVGRFLGETDGGFIGH